MKSLPYFRWYPADAETDAMYLSLSEAELGLFHRCLNHSWMNGGIPSDPRELSSCLRIAPRTISKLWPRISKMFAINLSDPSKMTNPRQEEERLYATAKSERATSAVRTRYERTTDVLQISSSVVAPRAYDADAVSVSVSEKTKKNTLPVLDSQSEFPLTIAEIRKHDAAVDETFVRGLVNKTVQYCMSHPKFPAELLDRVTDMNIARCCAESYKSGPARHGTGLLLSRVPPIVVTWALED